MTALLMMKVKIRKICLHYIQSFILRFKDFLAVKIFAKNRESWYILAKQCRTLYFNDFLPF